MLSGRIGVVIPRRCTAMAAQDRGVAIIRGLHTVIYGVMAALTAILLYVGATGRHAAMPPCRHAAWLWGAAPLLAIEVAS